AIAELEIRPTAKIILFFIHVINS
ncbi:hypothetical protein D039_3333B, partial [Vibrio parahaemolyticus EKP-028]